MNKALTLRLLEENLSSGKVLPQQTLTYGEFKNLNDEEELIGFLDLDEKTTYIVRSSFQQEDQHDQSSAGKFTSVLGVTQSNIYPAIKKVFESHDSPSSSEVVLIQPQLLNAVRSGVAFSHHPTSGQAYLIDNYTLGNETNAVTSGNTHGFKHVCYKSEILRTVFCTDTICYKLKKILQECSALLSEEFLDLEYGIDEENQIYVFQVRPLKIGHKNQINLTPYLSEIQNFVETKMDEHPFLAGATTVFGVMPDWNPAEMIGRKPKPLALSLYRELITDSIWAYQRDNYGYKALRSFPLMVEIGAQPQIDTRVSFNSLLPKGLTPSLEHKLVNFYLDKLSNSKNLHDRIEFEIVVSSWCFDLNEQLNKLPPEVDSTEKTLLFDRLLKVTKHVVLSDVVDEDIRRIETLAQRFECLGKTKQDHIARLYWLLEDCKRWGTLPFAGLARAAFMATQIIKSLERVSGKGYLLYNFQKTLNTVTRQMVRDLNELEKKDFIAKYGHLRPGTYDITSLTYSEGFDTYFNEDHFDYSGVMTKEESSDPSNCELRNELDLRRFEEQTGINSTKFLEFAAKSIFWREQSKFEFTKNLSEILETIISIGRNSSVEREELAFCNINDLARIYSSGEPIEETLFASINQGKRKFMLSQQIELPSVIADPKDIFSFTEEDTSPNFITSGRMIGKPTDNLTHIEGKIAVIEGADPGYDWIFQKGILGLITAYGGTNSHMAIRCAELDIPAVIGVGERLYAEITKAQHIYVDCSNRIIEFK